MKKIFILLLIIAVAVFYILAESALVSSGPFISRVIDGDTVELRSGEHVRLLGINAPEKGQYFSAEATQFLAGLVENKTVVLEADKEDKDKYGRLLRHIHIGDIFVSLELVKKGYATAYIIPPNEKYSDLIIEAENEAVESGIGVWSIKIRDAFCIGIFSFHYNARGDDNSNLNDEYVVLRNSCNYTVNMGGWLLKDASNSTYLFANFSLGSKARLRLNSGQGERNETDLYWNSKKAIWNNNGDRMLVYDKKGNLMMDYKY